MYIFPLLVTAGKEQLIE